METPTIKPGIHSSEFYLTLAAEGIVYFLHTNYQLNIEVAAVLHALIGISYILSRGWVKVKNSK